MITVLRKHHRWLMIVIAVLAVPFIFYFNKTDFSAQRSNDLGRIYDRPVTHVEFLRSARLMNLANSLGLTLGQDLALAASSEGEAYSEFTLNRLVLHHEADRFGLQPTASEITEFVKTLRPFRGAAGFEMNKYTEFVQSSLPSLGFNESQIEELVSDQLSLNRLKDLLGSAVRISDSESLENYQRSYAKMNVAVVRLSKEDFQKEVKVTDEEIAKSFEAQKAQLKSEEKRRVEFVAFDLAEADKKLSGKERIDALQKLADRANDFSQALLAKDANFAAVAGKFLTPVVTTEEFTKAAPDLKLAANPQLAQYAFVLNPTEPYSDPIQGTDGFAILHLLGVSEARPLSLEEAKPKLTETLKAERLRQLLSTKGAEVARQLREAAKGGKPLDQAAQQAGIKLERIPAFSLREAPVVVTDKDAPKEPKVDAPDLPVIMNGVAELAAGDVTELLPTEKGGVIAVLEKREPVDQAAFAQGRALFEAPALQRKRTIVFFEWLRERRRVAGSSFAATS